MYISLVIINQRMKNSNNDSKDNDNDYNERTKYMIVIMRKNYDFNRKENND